MGKMPRDIIADNIPDGDRIACREDIAKPDYGDAVDIHPNEVPVFWACGVTPQAVAVASKLSFLITHKPGHMFVSDKRDCDN